MGINIYTFKLSTDPIDQNAYNDFFAGLDIDLVPRSNGAPTDLAGSLGTELYRWKNLYVENAIIGGVPLDPEAIASLPNRIISGATRTDSSQPQFLEPDGTATTVKILAQATTLKVVINNDGIDVTADITKTGLTTAPATNNTCLVNSTALSGQGYTEYLGENGSSIPVDTMGSEITSRIGQYVALQRGLGEIMFAFVKSATELTDVFRGYFFDDSLVPIPRESLFNNDLLTLLELGWVFLDKSGIAADVSYLTPQYAGIKPTASTAGQYIYDLTLQKWFRDNGATWEDINRLLIGTCVINTTACIAARSADFSKTFDEHIDLEVAFKSVTKAETVDVYNSISVYGAVHQFNTQKIVWDIDTDLESGVSESAEVIYFLYITENGDKKISNEYPYFFANRKGYYHPYHTWRFVGIVYNDAGSDFNVVRSKNNDRIIEDYRTASGNFFYLPNVPKIKVTVIGGNGTSSWGSHCSATGGGSVFSGGIGAGGDINVQGLGYLTFANLFPSPGAVKAGTNQLAGGGKTPGLSRQSSAGTAIKTIRRNTAGGFAFENYTVAGSSGSVDAGLIIVQEG